MKWTPEQVTHLRELCMDKVSNKDIAAALGIPVEKVYAKRSQLGITIDKIHDVKDEKSQFIQKLWQALESYYPEIKTMTYIPLNNGEELVVLNYANGSSRQINVTADSLSAMLRDVAAKL